MHQSVIRLKAHWTVSFPNNFPTSSTCTASTTPPKMPLVFAHIHCTEERTRITLVPFVLNRTTAPGGPSVSTASGKPRSIPLTITKPGYIRHWRSSSSKSFALLHVTALVTRTTCGSNDSTLGMLGPSRPRLLAQMITKVFTLGRLQLRTVDQA